MPGKRRWRMYLRQIPAARTALRPSLRQESQRMERWKRTDAFTRQGCISVSIRLHSLPYLFRYFRGQTVSMTAPEPLSVPGRR